MDYKYEMSSVLDIVQYTTEDLVGVKVIFSLQFSFSKVTVSVFYAAESHQ